MGERRAIDSTLRVALLHTAESEKGAHDASFYCSTHLCCWPSDGPGFSLSGILNLEVEWLRRVAMSREEARNEGLGEAEEGRAGDCLAR